MRTSFVGTLFALVVCVTLGCNSTGSVDSATGGEKVSSANQLVDGEGIQLVTLRLPGMT